MRPQGEIRRALSEAAKALKAEQRNATWRDIAQRACVGLLEGRRTVENMARAGELQAVGRVRVAHSSRPMVDYAPRGMACVQTPGLDGLMRAWSR